jgi:hypothetical protein
MKWTPECVSLVEIEDLLTFAFESLYDDVKLIVMKKGRSVIITCSFAYELTSLLIAKATKNLKVLKKNGLKHLTIGYCTIYEAHQIQQYMQNLDDLAAAVRPYSNVTAFVLIVLAIVTIAVMLGLHFIANEKLTTQEHELSKCYDELIRAKEENKQLPLNCYKEYPIQSKSSLMHLLINVTK